MEDKVLGTVSVSDVGLGLCLCQLVHQLKLVSFLDSAYTGICHYEICTLHCTAKKEEVLWPKLSHLYVTL